VIDEIKSSILIIFLFLSFACLHAKTNDDVYQHSKGDTNKCVECHDMGKKKNYFHTPVKIGSCSTCHSFYNKTKNLLRIENTPELCVLCHNRWRVYRLS